LVEGCTGEEKVGLAACLEGLKGCLLAYSTYSAALESLFSDRGMVAGSLGRRGAMESSASSDIRGVAYIRRVAWAKGLVVEIRGSCPIFEEHKVNEPDDKILVAISGVCNIGE
jgi:hypothetical protein